MGEIKGVYTETMALVDAVLDGDLTQKEAQDQISRSYGAPFGEFLLEELERERERRNPSPGRRETYLTGLVRSGDTSRLKRFGMGDSFGTVSVYTQLDGDEVRRLRGFADLYPVSGGVAADIFLARRGELSGKTLWPVLETTEEDGVVRVDSITLVPWPSHDPAIPSLREEEVRG